MERALSIEKSQQEIAEVYQEAQEKIAETQEKLGAALEIFGRTNIIVPVDAQSLISFWVP